MKTIMHTSETRGTANLGWLNSYHSFSFGNYYNPERMSFGALRVLNDDTVSAGMGFGKHPHDNMEIISIPLEGDLEHKDSMGNTTVIKQGDIQVMSAGTGVFHSEYNKNSDKEVKFLQIWVIPNKKNVTPRYDQITIDDDNLENNLYQILSPNKDDNGIWIYQDAWFHMGQFEKGHTQHYSVKNKNNGVYIFVLEGNVTVENNELKKRDGLGIWDTNEIKIESNSTSKILVMEVPITQ
ncbi:pirin family protein [Aquimarina litoralis]|uniref:pirin family protein n=1 Tax=Aquimarina litoralis TaxID=584605 RepID=UPI001C571130|nr:pirin family protein [Aquimarina litoralis]MBW1295522.1 pirin family protein [Aquimarina litoralis]